MNTKQAMKVVIGADIDPSFKRAFQSADKQFTGLGKSITQLKKKQKLISEFEMNTVAVEKARIKLSNAQKAVMLLRKEVSKNPTKKLSKQLEVAKTKADRLAISLENERTKLSTVSTAMQKAGVSTKKYTQQNQELTRTLDKLQQRQQKLASIKQSQRNIKQGFGSMKGRAVGLAAAGATGVAATGSGLNFQSSASELQAKSKNMSDEERIMLENQAKQLQLKMKFTGAEVLQGQTFLSMAGFDANQIKSASKGMLDLAQASGMGLAESADISSNILSGFGLKAEEMGKVSDVLTQTFTSSNVTLSMLGETMKYVAPVASKAGASMEEVAAMTGLLGNVGIQGSQAGTALRAAFTRLSAPPKKAAKALEQLGLSAKDVDGNLRPMPVLLEEIAAKTKAMGTGDRAEVISKIFGTEANAAMQELIDKADDVEGGFKSMYQNVVNSQGKAAKVSSIMNDNVKGSFTRLQSSLSAIGQSMFEPFQGSIQGSIDSIANFVGKTAEWMGQHPELVRSVGMVAGGVFALGTASLAAKAGFLALKFVGVSSMGTLLRFTPVLGSMVRGFGLLKIAGVGSVKLLTSSFGLLTKALPVVVTAFRAVGVAMMANPIGMLVGAIAIGATLIIANWDKLAPWFSSMWDKTKAIFSSAWSAIKQGFLNFTPLGLVIKNWSGIKGYIGSVFSSVKTMTARGWQAVKSTFLNFTPLGLVTKKWQSIFTWFKQLPSKFSGFGSMIMVGLKKGLLSGVASVTKAISGVSKKITGKFKSMLGIKSPSRVFMQQGDFVMQGLQKGIDVNSNRPVSAIARVGSALQAVNDSAMSQLANPAVAATLAVATVAPVQLAAQPAHSPVTIHNSYEINIYPQAGENAEDMARQVIAEIEDHNKKNGSNLYDQGGY